MLCCIRATIQHQLLQPRTCIDCFKVRSTTLDMHLSMRQEPHACPTMCTCGQQPASAAAATPQLVCYLLCGCESTSQGTETGGVRASALAANACFGMRCASTPSLAPSVSCLWVRALLRCCPWIQHGGRPRCRSQHSAVRCLVCATFVDASSTPKSMRHRQCSEVSHLAPHL